MLERYFLFHNFSDRENITFSLLKVVPHVKDWWETYCEKRATEEYEIFVIAPAWDSFRDAIKEQYYPVGSYNDQYMRWTTLRQERDETIPDFTKIFYTFCTNIGIKEFERHMVLKYRDYLHRYIQTKMEFLYISSLGVTY
jgi:hypothetical protein